MFPNNNLKIGQTISSIPKLFSYNGIKMSYYKKYGPKDNPESSYYIEINPNSYELIELNYTLSEGLSAIEYDSENNEFTYIINV